MWVSHHDIDMYDPRYVSLFCVYMMPKWQEIIQDVYRDGQFVSSDTFSPVRYVCKLLKITIKLLYCPCVKCAYPFASYISYHVCLMFIWKKNVNVRRVRFHYFLYSISCMLYFLCRVQRSVSIVFTHLYLGFKVCERVSSVCGFSCHLINPLIIC